MKVIIFGDDDKISNNVMSQLLGLQMRTNSFWKYDSLIRGILEIQTCGLITKDNQDVIYSSFVHNSKNDKLFFLHIIDPFNVKPKDFNVLSTLTTKFKTKIDDYYYIAFVARHDEISKVEEALENKTLTHFKNICLDKFFIFDLDYKFCDSNRLSFFSKLKKK
ncbi:hypothetical protein [Carp edema virus]|nr:hypothetical protein [Carp edema virus]